MTHKLRDWPSVAAEYGRVEEDHRLPRLVVGAVRREDHVDVVLSEGEPE